MTATVAASSKTSTPNPKAAGKPSAADWLKVPQNRWIAGGVGVALVGLIIWFVMMSGRRKEEFAGRALDEARAAAESGNLPLAASEFQKVITTYGGTAAAQEAVINLNQVRLINGQQELAAVNLQDFIKSNPAPQFRGPAYGLLGRAYENSKRPGEAAAAYESASKAAEFDYLKADLLLDAARAWVNAGQKDKAVAAYRSVIKDYPQTSSRVEAQVRLAELTGGAM
ncbi:MAG TPA: tetratricopeptide repeat protein [Gemmatimonadales bacterium]|nr:tetratricopeptide repeat protein [Gemmatimonadales bacterium]